MKQSAWGGGLRWAGGAALLALVAGSVWWWQGRAAVVASNTSASGVKPPQSVILHTVQARDLPVVVEAAGTLVALNSVDIRPQLAATIRSVAIREGQMVRQGEVLFTLDDRAEQAALERAQATLLRDQASLADLQRQWLRAQELRAQNFIAQSAADTVLSQLEAQRALVVADEAALQSAKVSAGFGVIRSPLNGRAGAINVFPGSLVQPGGSALVTISQMHPLGVSFTLPEARLPALLAAPATAAGGQPVPALGLTVQPGGSGARGLAVSPVQGRLSFIDNAVDTTTGTIRLKGELPNADQQLLPGQYVTVRVTVTTLANALVVPQAALIQRGQDRQVYVVDGEGLAQLRPVKLRTTVGEWAAVDGLALGDRVVLEGKQNLRPGSPVKAASASGQAEGRPQ